MPQAAYKRVEELSVKYEDTSHVTTRLHGLKATREIVASVGDIPRKWSARVGILNINER